VKQRPIEIDFPIEQVNEIAEREAHAKEKYRRFTLFTNGGQEDWEVFLGLSFYTLCWMRIQNFGR